MIIVKTTNGDVFVNEKETNILEHLKDKKKVKLTSYDSTYSIKDVELVRYVSEMQPIEWTDEGSEVKKLRKEIGLLDLEKKKSYKIARFYEQIYLIVTDKLAKLQNGEESDKTFSEIEKYQKELDKELLSLQEQIKALESK